MANWYLNWKKEFSKKRSGNFTIILSITETEKQWKNLIDNLFKKNKVYKRSQ
jgi:hypothetical protein